MWKQFGLFLGCGSVIALAGCASTTQERLSALEQDVAELKVQAGDSITLEELFEYYSRHHNINPVLSKRYLKSIQLPENPTPAQVDEFFAKIYSLRQMNSDDEFYTLVTAKIIMAGKENVERLIPYLNFTPFSRALVSFCGPESKELFRQTIIQGRNSNSEIIRSYSQMVTAEDADEVIAMLSRRPEMIEAVRRLGLEKRALPVIQKMMVVSDGSISYEDEWLGIIVDHSTPEEFRKFSDNLWRRTLQTGMRNSRWNVVDRGMRLASMGFLPAFQYLTDNYQNFERNDMVSRLKVIANCQGEDFLTWYKKNRDSLFFNPELTLWDVKAAE